MRLVTKWRLMMLQTLITVCQTTVKARRVHIMRKLEKQIGVTCYCNHIKCGESEVWDSRVPLVITTKRQMWIFLSSWQLILIANPIWHEYTLTPDCRAARQAAVGNGRVALDSCEYVERIWSEGLLTKVTRLPVCKHRKRVERGDETEWQLLGSSAHLCGAGEDSIWHRHIELVGKFHALSPFVRQP